MSRSRSTRSRSGVTPCNQRVLECSGNAAIPSSNDPMQPMWLRQKLTTARRLGLQAAARLIVSACRNALYLDETLVVFSVGPDQINPVDPQLDDASWTPFSASLTSVPTSDVRLARIAAAEALVARPGQRMHWISVDDRAVSWGFSTPWRGPWPLSETRSFLQVPEGAVCLTAFETIPQYRGRRLYPAVLTRILEERFAEGVGLAYIWCRRTNRASYRAIQSVGFRELTTHRYRRVLGVPWRTERLHNPATTSRT